LSAFGLTEADFGSQEFALWPDNERAVTLFTSIATQWRTGMGGPIGLDYNVLFHRLDRLKLESDDYEQLFFDLRMMEREALDILHKKTG
jgi:hypothetical protein